jgi:hypothetical protein
MRSVPSGVTAGCFSLAAFAVAIVAGLSAQNPAMTIMLRAIAVSIICWPIGYLAGALCCRVIEVEEAAVAAVPDEPEPSEPPSTAEPTVELD